jgi:3-isopropylmalate/(R)-2-methylmalate dehydratase large subunit
MGMTITEKVLARAAGKGQVSPGETVWVAADLLMTHDVCGPGTIGVFYEQFGRTARVWDPDKVVIIPDHYIFTADAKAHRNVELLRQFVREQGIRYYYDPDFLHGDGMPTPYADPSKTSYKGVCHIALAEEGHTRPGEVLFGTDSHTCTAGAFGEFATGIGNTEAGFVLGTGKLWLKVPATMRFIFEGTLPPWLMAKDLILAAIGEIGCDGATYKAMEFSGDAVASLDMEERMTLCNMVIEAGGKNGVIAPDQKTLDYVRQRNRSGKPFEPVYNDADARFVWERVFDVSRLEPVVAKPHSPDNRAYVSELRGLKLDRAYIGSCTGGKLNDFRAAARILHGRSVRIDTFIVPATTEIEAALRTERFNGQTLAEIFQSAGARLGPASCAACLGGPSDTFGRLNAPLTCISATNRNFPGRMGHKQAQVYLASPLTVAASAVAGCIADPRDYL